MALKAARRCEVISQAEYAKRASGEKEEKKRARATKRLADIEHLMRRMRRLVEAARTELSEDVPATEAAPLHAALELSPRPIDGVSISAIKFRV